MTGAGSGDAEVEETESGGESGGEGGARHRALYGSAREITRERGKRERVQFGRRRDALGGCKERVARSRKMVAPAADAASPSLQQKESPVWSPYLLTSRDRRWVLK